MYDGVGRIRVYVKTGLDLTSGGPVPPINLFTTENNGLRWQTLHLVVRGTTITTVTTPATVALGTGVAGTNIIASKSLSSIAAANDCVRVSPDDGFDSIAASTTVVLGVPVQATATAFTCTVWVIGYYA